MQKLPIGTVLSLVLGGLLAGCAWDNSPPPLHSVITYNPSKSKTFLSNVPTTNAPSTKDWKTNQVAGIGYGTGPNLPVAKGAAEAVGSASSPSGISTGAGASPTETSPPPLNPAFNSISGISVSNTGSGLILTNSITGQTNSLPGPSRPTP